MWFRLSHLPFFFQLFIVAALSMIIPSAHALALENYAHARAFFYSSLLGLSLLLMIALAISNRRMGESGIQQLTSLALGFLLLPVYLAIPEHDVIKTTDFINAYLDMVSALTTTGFVVFEPELLPDTIHLWRAVVAWLGGALIWLVAVAILAPMNLGGFEVASGSPTNQTHYLTSNERKLFLNRNFSALLPIYLTLTGVLWFALTVSGLPGFDSLIFAMSILSTSGITAVKSLSDFNGNWIAEAVIFLFLIFAITRGVITRERSITSSGRFSSSTELWIASIIIVSVTVLLTIGQSLKLIVTQNDVYFFPTIKMIWANLFTVTSFLTTNGWPSGFWEISQIRTGFIVPGTLFAGLVLIGGGIATTAGGVKLLRVYALYANAVHEMDRLIHPSSIGQKNKIYQNELRSKAFIAWIFFMLFIIGLAAITLSLTAFGLTFEMAIITSVSALSTTGPLFNFVLGVPIDFETLGSGIKMTLVFAMILGRLEILVLLALFNSETWRS